MADSQYDLFADLVQPVPLIKRCSLCRVRRPISEFHRNSCQVSGYNSQCKSCVRPARKLYYEEHREEEIAYNIAYQAANPEKVREWNIKAWDKGREKFYAKAMERYYENHAEIRAADRERYANDPEYRAYMRENAAKAKAQNPEYFTEYMRVYRAENSDLYLTHSANYRAKKANADGSHTEEEWSDRLDYYGHCCAYCLKHTSEVGTLARDHMLPLSRGGSNDIDNLVPACRSCNSAKRDRTPLEFLARQSGFTAI